MGMLLGCFQVGNGLGMLSGEDAFAMLSGAHAFGMISGGDTFRWGCFQVGKLSSGDACGML